jgi:hypothetical protein
MFFFITGIFLYKAGAHQLKLPEGGKHKAQHTVDIQYILDE